MPEFDPNAPVVLASWRVSTAGRVATAVLCAVVVVIGLGSAIGEPSSNLLIALGWSIAIVLVSWFLAFRPSLSVTSRDEVIVVNPWRTYRIPFGEIESLHPGYDGVRFSRHGARAVCSWAVQESNLKMFTGGDSRAKRVVAEIVARMDGGASDV